MITRISIIFLVLISLTGCHSIDLTKNSKFINNKIKNEDEILIEESFNTQETAILEKQEYPTTTEIVPKAEEKDYSKFSHTVSVKDTRLNTIGKVISILENSEQWKALSKEDAMNAYQTITQIETKAKSKNDLICEIMNTEIDNLITNNGDFHHISDLGKIFAEFGLDISDIDNEKDYTEEYVLNLLNKNLDVYINNIWKDINNISENATQETEEDNEIEPLTVGKTYSYSELTEWSEFTEQEVSLEMYSTKTSSKATKIYTLDKWKSSESSLKKRDYIVRDCTQDENGTITIKVYRAKIGSSNNSDSEEE